MGTSAECGVNTFMCFMAGQEGMMRDPELIETMEAVSEVGGLVMVHAENGDMIKEAERKMMIAGITGPEGHAMAHTTEAEVEGVMRACVLANQMSCPLFICSLSQGMASDIEKKLKEVEERRKSMEASTLEKLAEKEKRAEEVRAKKASMPPVEAMKE